MCGIAGIYTILNQETISKRVDEARISLAHRGPDDSGLFIDEEVGISLTHTRLAILDPSLLGHQPMLSDDESIALVYNGEIYNFTELRSELEMSGYKFKSNSDTEVLLKLAIETIKNGNSISDMLKKINGIFAFAVWDKINSQLFIARDAMGVKPLYYSHKNDLFAFASEIMPLKKLINGKNSIDINAIDLYLKYLWCPGNSTPDIDIKKLGPGEFIRVIKGEIVEKKAWFDLPFSINKNYNYSKEKMIDCTIHHLRSAVHRQMISDAPLGSFLSGGVDSSSIVNFAKEINPDIKCFTIQISEGSENGVDDDLPFAKIAASHLGVPLEVVSVDSKKMAEDLPKMIEILEEPLSDPAPLNVLYISQLARERGIKVLLSGVGGDDIFTGYRRHAALEYEKYWSWLPESTRFELERFSSKLDQRVPFFRKITKLLNGSSLNGDMRIANYFKWLKRRDLESLYSSEFKLFIMESNFKDPILSYLESIPKEVSRLERMLAVEQKFFLADHNLNYTDKMSMFAGVEVRVPFLDMELVNFVSQIPNNLKQRGRVGKWILKKAMEPYLPREILYRNKTGFGVPLRRWIRYDLHELMRDTLSERNLKNRNIFDYFSVSKLIADNDKGRIDASYTLFSLMCIELSLNRLFPKASQTNYLNVWQTIDSSATGKPMRLY